MKPIPASTVTSTSPAAGVPLDGVRAVQVPMRCDALMPTVDFFVQRVGFRIDAIFPAESPRIAILSGYGVSLRLGADVVGGVEALNLLCDAPERIAGERDLEAPNGVRIRFSSADPQLRLPETRQAWCVSRNEDDAQWTVGRAGLRYRDLLPARHGGAFIASHIRILSGGPVPDYVHFHKVRFQMIFCRAGWVRVVYEGQGEPFVLNAGDCVLQPPRIRHRVLESSAGAEVIELGAPAEHVTMVDHDMALPTAARYPADHDFDGQRFVRHVAAQAGWEPWRMRGFECADTGIGMATGGLAGVRVVRRVPGAVLPELTAHDTEFCFFFVLAGSLTVLNGHARIVLNRDDSVTLPGAAPYAFEQCSDDLELLEVTLPADFSV
ncbi:cupin [Burkholderia sp. IMCC1007]|uniref:cupin n=1 Tax=Burkholderia sp. IMCC1007 TaxID=3004104 RepID=UPI0022B5E289|nr:cupin [Burkholderia sp. IMCC1007]